MRDTSIEALLAAGNPGKSALYQKGLTQKFFRATVEPYFFDDFLTSVFWRQRRCFFWSAMDLLSVASVKRKLSHIEDTFGLEQAREAEPDRVSGVDRFFWLRASKRPSGSHPRYAFRSGLSPDTPESRVAS